MRSLSLAVGLVVALALSAGVLADDPSLGDQIEGTLGEVESATDRLERDLESLTAHLGEEAGGGGGELDAEAEAAVEQLRELADSDEGKELFEQLRALNEELERSGVKAFGDLEESAYRRGGDGDWVIEALAEDIDACKTEMQTQADEAAGGQQGAEEVEPAPAPGKMGLRSSGGDDSEAEASEEEGGGAAPGPKLGLRSSDEGSEKAAPPPAEKMQLKEGGGEAKAPKLGLRDDGAGEKGEKVCEVPEAAEEASGEASSEEEEPASEEGGQEETPLEKIRRLKNHAILLKLKRDKDRIERRLVEIGTKPSRQEIAELHAHILSLRQDLSRSPKRRMVASSPSRD